MQLGHPHRQLLSRSLRWYSARTAPENNSSDAIASSGAPVSPRLKRPSASTFEGINIQNVVIPTKSASQGFHNRTNRPSRSNGPSDQSRDGRREGQPERNRGMRRGGGTSSMSGWGDGLVSLSFSSRLKLHQKQMTGRDDGTGPVPQEARSWKQNSNQAQRHGPRRGQEQGDNASRTYRRHGQTEKSAPATADVQQRTNAQNDEPKTSSMTRPLSSSTFKPRSTTTPAPSHSSTATARATKPKPKSTSSPTRKARLAVLSNTNLNELFRTDDAATAGVSIPATARARVRGVIERSGDYSRFLPPSVDVHENTSPLPALLTAHHALATQRDVSLEQRRVALHIIERLVQPREARL